MMRRASKVYRETIRNRPPESTEKKKRKVKISEKEEVFDPSEKEEVFDPYAPAQYDISGFEAPPPQVRSNGKAFW